MITPLLHEGGSLSTSQRWKNNQLLDANNKNFPFQLISTSTIIDQFFKPCLALTFFNIMISIV